MYKGAYSKNERRENKVFRGKQQWFVNNDVLFGMEWWKDHKQFISYPMWRAFLLSVSLQYNSLYQTVFEKKIGTGNKSLGTSFFIRKLDVCTCTLYTFSQVLASGHFAVKWIDQQWSSIEVSKWASFLSKTWETVAGMIITCILPAACKSSADKQGTAQRNQQRNLWQPRTNEMQENLCIWQWGHQTKKTTWLVGLRATKTVMTLTWQRAGKHVCKKFFTARLAYESRASELGARDWPCILWTKPANCVRVLHAYQKSACKSISGCHCLLGKCTEILWCHGGSALPTDKLHVITQETDSYQTSLTTLWLQQVIPKRCRPGYASTGKKNIDRISLTYISYFVSFLILNLFRCKKSE